MLPLESRSRTVELLSRAAGLQDMSCGQSSCLKPATGGSWETRLKSASPPRTFVREALKLRNHNTNGLTVACGPANSVYIYIYIYIYGRTPPPGPISMPTVRVLGEVAAPSSGAFEPHDREEFRSQDAPGKTLKPYPRTLESHGVGSKIEDRRSQTTLRGNIRILRRGATEVM